MGSEGGAVHEWPGKSYNWFRTFVAELTNSYRAIEARRIPVVVAVRGQTNAGRAVVCSSLDQRIRLNAIDVMR
jgi:hypothetical protein